MKKVLLFIIMLLISQLAGRSLANVTVGDRGLSNTSGHLSCRLDLGNYYNFSFENNENSFTNSPDDSRSQTNISFSHRLYNLSSYHLQNGSQMFTVSSTGNADENRFWGFVFNSHYFDDNGQIIPSDDSNMNIVPAPGAILLGSIGISILSWLRCRKRL